MTRQEELFARAAEGIAEISVVLEQLKATHPEHPLIQRCTEVQEQLSWYLNHAKEKLGKNEFTESDATALAVIVDRGMQQMIRIVEGDENIKEKGTS